MKILEYDKVDPWQVLDLTMLALDFPMTPAYVENLRRTDPRPFPCLTINAVKDNQVLAQVGLFRLPMVSMEGREDIGGVWAVSTHPAHAGRGAASALLEEAHARMRAAGLRFSSLGTNRYRTAYRLYQQHGYVETNVWATALAKWETAHQPTRLRAQPAGLEGYQLVEEIFLDLARDYLGFAWRHTPFARLRLVSLQDIWILWENRQPVGYALTRTDQTFLTITNLVLKTGMDSVEAVSAITANIKTDYVKVKISRPSEIESLRRAGYRIAHPDWGAFMVKPLIPGITANDAVRIFGIGTDRFLISWLDTT